MSYLLDLLDLFLGGLQVAVAIAAAYVKSHPVAAGVAVLALLRLFGTTVETGSKGVLFVFGRVRKELEPGFHPLFPLVMTARKTPVRSVTLDLPRQRVTTADGLVYDVQANIVYRVADPKLALTQVDNLRQGIEAKLAMIAADLLRGLTRAAIVDGKAQEAELSARAEQKLGRWGVAVEQVGFKSIAPTKKTLRLTQLALLSDERQRVVQELIAQGVSENSAVALLGADRRLVSHGSARYHALHRPARLAPAAAEAPHTPPQMPGEEPPVAEKPPQAEQAPTPETQVAGSVLAAEREAGQAPPQPKKTTKGVLPRSWLRLQGRLQLRRASNDSGPAVQAAGSWG